MELERVSNITKDKFVRDYIAANRPVVVTDSIQCWNSQNIWSPEYFLENFGRSSVQVYDDLFTLETISTLRQYFDKYWYNHAPSEKHIPYVRWYSKFKPVEFFWSDEAFVALSEHWTSPYFLPDSEYILPYCPKDRTITPVLHPFPGKGLFISAAGARTRLHRDPWASDAILCQVFGEKRVVMYTPEKGPALTSGNKVVDIDTPDADMFSRFSSVEPDFVDVLRCKETLYIPAGWFHHVTSLSNSISITWNFVSMARWPNFLQYVLDLDNVNEDDRTVLKHFACISDGAPRHSAEVATLS